MFGGATSYAYRKRLGTFSEWGPALYGALWSIIGTNLFGIIALALDGSSPLTQAIFSINPYISILACSALIAGDTHEAIKFYKAGKYDHMLHSVEIYENLIRFLFKILGRILGKKK